MELRLCFQSYLASAGDEAGLALRKFDSLTLGATMFKNFALLLLMPVALTAQCVNFPANFIPLASVANVTAANSNCDRLVVGALTDLQNG